MRNKNRVRAGVAVILMAAAVLVSGCGGKSASSSAPQEAYESGSSYNSADYRGDAAAGAATEAAYEEDYAEAEEPRAESNSAGAPEEAGIRQAQDGEKIIYTANLEIQTLGYDETVSSIRRKITAAGGFIESEYESDNNYRWYEESSNGSTRYLSLTIRIPSEQFSTFLESLEGDGKITSRTVNASNISQRYSDTEATKKALEIEQERLLAMMDRAETIEDMITVEARLSEVERELNNYRTQLSGMDRDVQYSTIYVNLQEVRRYTQEVREVTYLERLQEAAEDAITGFVEFMEDLSLFVVRNFPFLIILLIIILLIGRKIRRNRERRAQLIAANGAPTRTAPGRTGKRRFFSRGSMPDNRPEPGSTSDPGTAVKQDKEDGKPE